MAKVQNRVRDEDTGVGEASVSVSIDKIDGGANVDSVSTDADGRFTWQANGSPGYVEWTATDSGQTRTVAGDMSIQTGPVYTGEFDKLLLIFGDGVVGGGDDELEVVEPSGGGLNVDVGTGVAFAKGIPYVAHTAETLAIGANASGNPRIDRIIVRVTRTGTDIYAADVVVLAGTPAATPSEPALTQDDDTWEISLAQVAVANGAGSILTANITDERDFAPGTTLDGSITLAKLAPALIGTGASQIAAGDHTHEADAITGIEEYVEDQIGANVVAGAGITATYSDATGQTTIAATGGITVVVQEGDVTRVAETNTIDFDASDFAVSQSPTGEANISLAYGIIAGTPAEGNHTHSQLHDPVTVLDTGSINLTLVGQQVSGVVLPAGVSHNDLLGLDSGDPHTQYVEISGDTMSGPLTVNGALTANGDASLGNAASDDVTVNGHLIGPSTGPSIAVEAAAGTGASAAITGNDNWGTLDLTTGTGASTGEQCTVTFGTARPDTNYGVFLFPRELDSAAAQGRLFAHGEAATHWDLNVITTALPDSTLHQWNYLVVEW